MDRCVASFVILVLTSSTGCLGPAHPDPETSSVSPDWGMGLPQHDELLPEPYAFSSAESDAFDALMAEFHAEVPCERKVEANPATTITTVSHILNDCRLDIWEAARGAIGEGATYGDFQDNLTSLTNRIGSFLEDASEAGRPSYEGLAELHSFLGYRVIYMFSTMTWAQMNYATFNDTGNPMHQETAWANVFRVNDRFERAEIFFGILEGRQSFCGFADDLALERLSASIQQLAQTVQGLKDSGEMSALRGGWAENTTLPAAKRTLNGGIAFAADSIRLQVDYSDELLKAVDAKRLPTRGESIYLMNSVIEGSHRPGIVEQISMQAPLVPNWEEQEAHRAIAIAAMDWNDPAPPECTNQ